MTDGTKQAVGLSVGTTTLAAVTSDNTVRRSPVLTLFEDRPPVIGGPAGQGVTITDFVDRVGDPIGIIASDGTSHRPERVLTEALRALAYEATGGRPLPASAAVTVPAHWQAPAVDAFTRALGRVPEWRTHRPAVISDVTASVTALNPDPGLPTHGVIAVCDFGGSGTSITLVDADRGYQPIAPTVRHLDFSGDLVDQALLTHVIGELAGAGSVDLNSTSAIGSLWRLRAQCRGAKERLSTATVTSMPVELPEFRGDIRLTRTELDDLLRAPLAEFVNVLSDTLQRNGVHPANLSAVASVGGGAGIAAVTTTLSDTLRVPVITTARSGQSPAVGAALRALRGPADDTATAMAPAALVSASAATPVAADPGPVPALAWSEAADEPDELEGLIEPDRDHSLTGARPALEFEPDEHSAATAETPVRWYRRPMAVMAASIVVILGAVGAIGVVLMNDSSAAPASTPTPSISTTPEAPAAAAPPPAEQPPARVEEAAPAPRTVVATPAPVTRVVQQQAPAPVTVQAPPPAPADPPPPPVTETVTQTVSPEPTTQAPPPSQEPPSTEAPAPAAPSPTSERPHWIPTIPPIPTIPGLPPFVPQPVPNP